MNKKIYVNGGIVIMTPYFKYLKSGCRYDFMPSGCELLETNGDIDGSKCLIITDEKAPSIFNEYYAKTFFSAQHKWVSFFHNSLIAIHNEFNERIDETLDLLDYNDVNLSTGQTLYRLCLISAVAALDTWVSDVILYKITRSKEIFKRFMLKFNVKKDIIHRVEDMWINNTLDNVEQEIITKILHTSFSNLGKIKDFINLTYNISIDIDKDVDDLILERHIIVHRSGKRKSGELITYSKGEVKSKIFLIRSYIDNISDQIKNTEK